MQELLAETYLGRLCPDVTRSANKRVYTPQPMESCCSTSGAAIQLTDCTVCSAWQQFREQVRIKANAAQTVGKSSDTLQGEGGEVFNGATKRQVPSAGDLAE